MIFMSLIRRAWPDNGIELRRRVTLANPEILQTQLLCLWVSAHPGAGRSAAAGVRWPSLQALLLSRRSQSLDPSQMLYEMTSSIIEDDIVWQSVLDCLHLRVEFAKGST